MTRYNYYKPEDVIAALKSGNSILENECTKFLVSTYYGDFLGALRKKGFRFRDDQKKSLWHDTIRTFIKKVLADKYTVQERTKLSTYLTTIGVNYARNERRKKDDPIRENDVDIPSTEEETGIDVELLGNFLQKLPEKCRSLLTLFHFKDMKQSDIAELHDSTEGSIKVQISQCKAKLFLLIKSSKYEFSDFFN